MSPLHFSLHSFVLFRNIRLSVLNSSGELAHEEEMEDIVAWVRRLVEDLVIEVTDTFISEPCVKEEHVTLFQPLRMVQDIIVIADSDECDEEIVDPNQEEIIDVVSGMMQSLVAAVVEVEAADLVKREPRLVWFDPPEKINNVIHIDSDEDEV